MKKPAILGGEPAFKEPLHVGRPNLPDRRVFDKYVDRIFDSRWLTNNGPLVREFQEKLEEYLQVKHVIPVCNGTIALELAERALGFEKEVILPSFTFIATAHSLQWQQITPVFADIGENDVTIAPNSIRKLLTPNTTGIIGVHVYGNPCDYLEIDKIAKEKNLKVLYDAAHAFGNEVNGIPIANLGDASVFSFHATKFFNTFEGGAIATNNAELADILRLMTNFGFTGKDKVDYLGVNGKMTEISAAMGLAMLDCIEDIKARNQDNFRLWSKCIREFPGISLVEPSQSLTASNFQYVIACIGRDFPVSRDLLIGILEAEGLKARRYFYPGCHRLQPYATNASFIKDSLLNTDELSEQVVSLPNGQQLSEQEINKFKDILDYIVDHSAAFNFICLS